MKIRTKFNTGISFFEKASMYVPGKGNADCWNLFKEGTMTVFPCEWRMNFRTRSDEKFSGNAEGSIDFAKIRMPYIPRLYNKLETTSMIIVKGGYMLPDENSMDDYNQAKYNDIVYGGSIEDDLKLDGPNYYRLWGSVDNMHEENRYMEFAVRRYEEK